MCELVREIDGLSGMRADSLRNCMCQEVRLWTSALRRSRRAAAADFFVAPPPPIFRHRRAAAAAADFLVGAPPTQYIAVSIFSWTVL